MGAVATIDITTAVRQSGLPAWEQLALLVEKVSSPPGAKAGGDAVEPALRDWGRTDAMARQVLERVDRQRLDDLRDFFGAAGLAPTASGQAAAVLYATVIGLESLRLTAGIAMREPLQVLAPKQLPASRWPAMSMRSTRAGCSGCSVWC